MQTTQRTARSTARRRLAAAGLVLLVPALGACGFSEYQTDKVYQPSVGSDVRSDGVDVLGAVIVSTTEGQGTFVASLVSSETGRDDELTGISGDDVQGSIASPVEVPRGSLVNLADTGAVSITGESVTSGSFVPLELEFSTGQKISVDVPVVPKDGPYAEVKTASPSASPSPAAG